ncbi:family 43 glycosylhydrolase [Catenuloplanes japonicus]|uniref:family 43 glycosylhydrolase n=1 Tax=Catenuloplanes japonicus TaxID=33876 RepID=UPI0005277590|nr:family 43 glycosylhydrolase [Catenuloplanes japonicus]
MSILGAKVLAGVLVVTAVSVPAPPVYTTSEAGNPFVSGWYADPDVAIYNNRFYVFPTSSRPYDQQTYLDAFSTTDLVNWTKHPNVLTTANVSWARRAVWAPAPITRNGRYYLYFGANDIQSNNELGGIGVAVADAPEGPYRDAIGAPLIPQFVNGAQPIDQDVFIDDDGQAYIYYGGWGHANVAKVNSDMTSLGTFPDGSTFKEITPSGYTEGPQMFKRNGKYYLMWSEGGWTGPNYSVAYAIADAPTGPFNRVGSVLTQDSAVARGAGHNSVLNIPGTDIWYIFYHRRPLSETDGNSRELAYDRMTFNADGTIAKVTMLVKDNFADGNAFGWKTYGGTWTPTGGSFAASSSFGGKALLDDNHVNAVYDVDVTIGSGPGDAGLVFRAGSPAVGVDAYRGYYAGITPRGQVVLGKADNNWTQLGLANVPITPGTRHHLRVQTSGTTITVFVDDLTTPRITVTDGSFTSGKSGVRVYNTSASFDNVVITNR